jgi:twitching motility protein PilI
MSAELRALRDQPFELLEKLEERLRAARIDYAAGQQEYWIGLGFRLGEDWLVTPREEVREVIVPPPLTRVPRTRPWFAGLANVRGNLLPVVDLQQLMGVGAHIAGDRGRVLVLNSEDVPVGFLVDEVAGYRQFVPPDQKHSLADGAGPVEPYLLGAFERDGRVWRAFSLHKVTLSDTFKLAGYE